MWVDSHCHLTHETFIDGEGFEPVIKRANAAGVGALVSICSEIVEEFPVLLREASKFDNVWCSVGSDPEVADNPVEQQVTEDQIVELANSSEKVIGIGETGLDFYYDHATREEQEDMFRKHLKACVRTGLPVIVHSRDAEEATARLLREESAGGKLTGLIHCFSSGEQLAIDALELGFYISFSGILTFKKSHEIREIAAKIPLDRLLVETDSPYLSPEPFRGKTNEPEKVIHTGKVLAEVHGVSEEDMARITTENFFRLFSKAKLKE